MANTATVAPLVAGIAPEGLPPHCGEKPSARGPFAGLATLRAGQLKTTVAALLGRGMIMTAVHPLVMNLLRWLDFR